MLFKIHSPSTQNLCLCGHERAAAASGSNLPPKTLEMLSCGNRGKQQSGRMMHQLCSTFFLPISALGDVFPYPRVTFLVPGLHSMGDNKSCRKSALGLFILFSPHSLAEVLQLSYLPSTGLQTINQPQPPTRGEKLKEGDVRSLRLLLL